VGLLKWLDWAISGHFASPLKGDFSGRKVATLPKVLLKRDYLFMDALKGVFRG
jgi:hypothetical protein